MSLPAGKVPHELLARLLRQLPAAGRDVLLGPALGEDAAVIDVEAGPIVVSTDPITLTSSQVGAFAVDVNANDVAVTGARPRWFLATILLPPGSTPRELEAVFDEMSAALRRLGASLVGGHTEVTPAVSQPVVVGQMIGTPVTGRVLTTGGAGAGDVLVQVGPVPVEGASVLADAVEEAHIDPGSLSAARAATQDPGISVVDAALLAADAGATSLHDPTEGGLAAGLHELASAAGLAAVVDRDAVEWFAPGLAVCEVVGADPWATLASGCLLATFAADASEAAVTELTSAGHTASVIGRLEDGEGVRDIEGTPVPWPEVDEAARLA